MLTEDKIITVYRNAREFVRQGRPKEARKNVLILLNDALERYNSGKLSIVTKVKTEAFMTKWLEVASTLREKGVTEYVMVCFGLAESTSIPKPEVISSGRNGSQNNTTENTETKSVSAPKSTLAEIDIAGLIEEDNTEAQGWCAKIFEDNRDSIVKIYSDNGKKGICGTGFIVSDKGYLLTNDHLVYDVDTGRQFESIKMKPYNCSTSYKLSVLFSDQMRDVALCSFIADKEKFIPVKRIADYSTLRQGADCLAIGNALGMGLAPISGVVKHTKDQDGDLVYTALSNHGDSGGAIFNRRGECIGIHKATLRTAAGEDVLGFACATPMCDIDELLDKWGIRL